MIREWVGAGGGINSSNLITTNDALGFGGRGFPEELHGARRGEAGLNLGHTRPPQLGGRLR